VIVGNILCDIRILKKSLVGTCSSTFRRFKLKSPARKK